MATSKTKHKSGGPTPQVGQGAKKAAESIGFLAIIAVVLVLANVAGHFFFARADLTPNKIFTLSQGSERLVSDLEDDLNITVYYTSGLPAEWSAHERHLRDLLLEYVAAGNGHVNLRWVDPDDEEEKEEAREAGINESIVGGQDSTSATLTRGFVGMVLQHVEKREVVNFVSYSTEGLEYTISSLIQQMVHDKIPVGVVSGHGSPTLTEGLAKLSEALSNYELRPVDVAEEIDQELRALLIIDPSEPFTRTELQRINQYVMRGGSLGIFGGAVHLQLQGGMGGPTARVVDTQLDQLLTPWGMELRDGLVIDAVSERLPMRTPMGPALVPYMPWPVIRFDDEAQRHPVTFRIPNATFRWTGAVETSNRFDELEGTVLARSSEQSGLLTGESISIAPRDPREWLGMMTANTGPFPVLVALQGELPSAFTAAAAVTNGEGEEQQEEITAPARSEEEARVLVAGTGWMLRDELLQRTETGVHLTPDLIVALNAIDWLTQDADLIAVRAKSVDEPRIETPETIQRDEAIAQAEQAEAARDAEAAREAQAQFLAANEAMDKKKLSYQIVFSAGLPLLFAAFGLIRWRLRTNKRASLQEIRRKLRAAKNR